MGKRGYFDPGSIEKPLLHTWSLGVEEQFYLVLPWLLMLAARRGYRPSWLIAGTVAVSLALSIVGGIANWSSSYFLLPTRFWELGIGGLIAILPLQDRLASPTSRAVLGLTGLAAIVWSSISLSESNSFPGYLALAPVLGAAALIVANGGPVNRAMVLPPFAWVGRLSYALYLWHWPLIVIAAGLGFSLKDATTRFAVIGLSLVLSFVGYNLWEMPIRHRRLLASQRSLFVALAVCVVALVGTGALIFNGRGLPQRLPKDIFQTYDTTKKTDRLILKTCPEGRPVTTPCPVGAMASSEVSFVIVGDSHSESVAAEVGDIAAQYGLHGLFLGKSACKLFTKPVGQEDDFCIPQNEFLMDQYNRYKPRLVIAVVRWPTFLNGGNPDIRSNSWYATFDKTLGQWSQSTVVTSIAIPMYDTDISEIGMRAWFRSRLGLPAFSIPGMSLEEYRRAQADAQNLLDTLALGHRNLRTVDPASVFCPQGLCSSIVDGKPLYFDDNHPSHAGALFYASLFRPYLEALARQLAASASTPQQGSTEAPPAGN